MAYKYDIHESFTIVSLISHIQAYSSS